VLFLAAIVAAFSYLRLEEKERETEAIKRDVEYSQQRMRLRLLERQEQLMHLAQQLNAREIDPDEFTGRAEALVQQFPELQTLSWVDERRRIRTSHAAPSLVSLAARMPGEPLRGTEAEAMYGLARELMQPVYSQPAAGTENGGLLQLHIPLGDRRRFAGVLLAEYSIDSVLRYAVPPEVSAKYAVALLDAQHQLLAGSSVTPRMAARLLPWLDDGINAFEVPVSPVGNGLVLRAQAWRTSQGLVGTGLFWLVLALSGLTAWMLIGNWRHTRRRLQAQRALLAETTFRRAMENSMLTGMRALDLQGRITYVNPAFCQMTGWNEMELVGLMPPFPYWPDADRELLMARLDDELQGRTIPGGFQVRVKRKNGSLFDARMYVSPLIDSNGRQTGWMTSMTDITEPNRVRAQLEAAHQRFTTVMEALDASVSVAPLGSEELLFANKLYRLWFGSLSRGHLDLVTEGGLAAAGSIESVGDAADAVDGLAGLPADTLEAAGTESAEVFVAGLDKWLEIRTRYLTWVDGRLAQMLIATDITARRRAEALAAQQAERAQNASRLITMGEMASSVAHELNQPLTAISNYCNGMVSRIKGQQIEEADLLAALEKTSRQAQRAGQIIQRIRSFVKRSEPNRTPSDVATMVNEAVELAEIELRRQQVRLSHYVAARLPQLLVDPILIEQVLVNLLKNAAESINSAHRELSQRNVELRVVRQAYEGQPGVVFTVRDSGRGLAPEVLERLFEAFFSTKAEGMGIGLNLCRSIVESHQGRMEAQNIYNGADIAGCVFSFWIPEPGAAQDTSDKSTGVTA
jgi:PAS domain S-box-containing protein